MASSTDSAPRFSIVVPCHDVRPWLRPCLDSVLGQSFTDFEVIAVDGASSDGTDRILAEYAAADPRVRAVSLSRNFGHQQAITAALDHATGDAVLVMDADLQDTPESIPQFVDLFLQGYDVVYAQRVARKEAAWKRAAYYGFYRLAARLSTVPLPLDAGDFGLMSRRVVDLLRAMPERHRYLRGLRAWAGFRQEGVRVERAQREAGESKYSLRKLMKLAFDGIFAFSVVPLRAATFLGVVAMALASAYALYATAARIFWDRSPQGFTALIVAITFLSGVQLLFLGVIGEYIGRIYEEVKGRPAYVVDRVIRGGAADPPR